MSKAELDRKMFLMRTIPYFCEIPKMRFDQLYKSFIAKFLSKDDYIYLENKKADIFYLIYQGSCSLKKNILISDTEEKSKNVTIMKLEKGDIAGLEASDYIPETIIVNGVTVNQKKGKDSKDPVYKYSLISEDDNTIVMSIKIQSLNEFRENIVKCLLPLRKKKDKNKYKNS